MKVKNEHLLFHILSSLLSCNKSILSKNTDFLNLNRDFANEYLKNLNI